MAMYVFSDGVIETKVSIKHASFIYPIFTAE